MRLLDRVFGTKPEEQKKPETESRKLGKEVGIASSDGYSNRSFPKWEMDSLKASKGQKIYEKMMQDDQVKACVRFKQNAVLSRQWYFDVDKEDPEQVRMGEFFEAMLDQMHGVFKDKLIGTLSALINGYSVQEKVFSDITYDGRTYWGVKDIKLRPSDTFSGGMVVDPHGNIEKIMQTVEGMEINIPMEKLILFVHQPDLDPHYGQSDLNSAYPHYYSKELTKKFRDIFLERLAGGFIWAQVTGGLTPVQETNLKAMMNNVSTRMGAIVPDSVKLNVDAPKDAKAFGEARVEDDKAIAKSLLVPNLMGITEQGSVGAYSLGEIQMLTFFWTLDELSNRLADTMNEQMFRQLAQWNFNTDQYPMFCFEPISEQQKIDLIKTWSDLVGKGAVTKTDTDEAHIRNILDMPEKPEEEDDLLPDEDDEPEDEDLPSLEDLEGLLDEENFTHAEKADFIGEYIQRPWLRRVDFSSIKRMHDANDDGLIEDLSKAMARVHYAIDKQIAKVAGQRSFGNIKLSEFQEMKVPQNLVSEIRKAFRTHMQQALEDSYKLAQAEIPKKMAQKIIRAGMDKTQTERFLSSEAMMKTKNLTEDVIKNVMYTISNAIKYDRTLKFAMAKIEEDVGDLLNPYDSEGRAVTDAGGRVINKPARIENIARTNIGIANNQARQALFGQPEMKGFIEAYEYSAILDTRTTTVCQALHGLIRKDWGDRLPPNHFQCRSLLIAVTVLDNWDGKESSLPKSGKPMKGFN